MTDDLANAVDPRRLPPCSALEYLPREGLMPMPRCRNGFNTNVACAGISAKVVLPECLQEEWCGQLYERTGGRPPTPPGALKEKTS